MPDLEPDLNQAAHRLERAIGALEGRLKALKDKGPAEDGDLFASPSSREKALESAAAEASAALGRAAAEVRAILNGEG